MFGILASVCFGVAFILNGVGGDHSIWFSPMSLLLLGLTFFALHMIGASERIRR